jgi:ATP-dependent RNA helicase DDX52/ROK1
MNLVHKKSERVAEIRRQHKIKVEGSRVPPPLDSFDKLNKLLNLDIRIMRRIKDDIKYVKPTPVQMQAIPIIAKNRDVIALAETGSGKSLAFILPILAKMKLDVEGYQALVLVPTRELAKQINRQFLVFNPFPRKAKILVSTPLRLVKIIKEQKLDLSTVRNIVVDEADALFEMGFIKQVNEIIKGCTHSELQKSYFSATMLPAIEEVLRENMNDPIKITSCISNATNSNIEQKLVYCGGEEGKIYALRNIFRDGFVPPMLVFVQSKERAIELYNELGYEGVSVSVITGDVIKGQRDENVNKLRTGKLSVLICTDVMSRGIDFPTVNWVVNYDFPQSIISYIHRVGRTGRAGKKGTAVTLYTDSDVEYLRSK